MVEGIAMATCRNLLGEQPTERLRVWFHNGEDNIDELNRRLAAICQHFDIPMEELRGWWFMTSGNEVPLRVAKGYSNLTIDTRLIKCITEAIGDNQIDTTILDPLVTLHGVPENDTGKMDTVCASSPASPILKIAPSSCRITPENCWQGPPPTTS